MSPRSKEFNQRAREERRQQILSCALDLFTRKGLAGTKITDISSAVNMSQGLLYHYFQSKEEIFVELIRLAFTKLNEACRWLAAQPLPAGEKIRFAISELLKGLSQNEDNSRYHLLIAQATISEAIPEEAKQTIRQENRFPYEAIASIMAEGQKDGSVKKQDAQELAMVFWTSINGLAIYKAVHGEKFKAPNPEILIGTFLNAP